MSLGRKSEKLKRGNFRIQDPTSKKAKKGLDAHSQIHNNHHSSHPKLTLFPYRQQTKQIADDYKAREESWTKTQSEFEEKIKHEIDQAEKAERYINEHLANAVEEAFKNCMGQRAVQFYLDRMVFRFHVTINN